MFKLETIETIATELPDFDAVRKLTVSELRLVAKGRIPGYTKFKKAELVERVVGLLTPVWSRVKAENELEKINQELAEKQAIIEAKELDPVATEKFIAFQLSQSGCVFDETTIERVESIWKRCIEIQEKYDANTGKAIAKETGVLDCEKYSAFGETVHIGLLTKVTGLLNKAKEIGNVRLVEILTAYRNGFKIKAKMDKAMVNHTYQIKVSDINREMKPIDGDGWVEGAVSVLSKACEARTKKDGCKILFALSIVTGRRLYAELLHQGRFEEVDGEVLFTGLAKSKTVDKSGLQIPIPVLCDFQIIRTALDALERLGMIDRESPARLINKKYNPNMSRMMSNILKDYPSLETPIPAKSARDIYAAICVKRFKGVRKSVNAFLSEILGHNANDITTACSYQKFVDISGEV